MNFLEKIVLRVLLAVEFILVFLFILFEEIIWEGLAQPIYYKIQSLKILHKLQTLLNKIDNYTLLIFFTALLLSVEIAGVLAGIFFIQGKVIFGILLYMLKIPIAGFTFWLFRVSKNRLLSFRWFAFAYGRVIYAIDWIKSTEIYINSLKSIKVVKVSIKRFKERYFIKNSHFMEDIKTFYYYIKNYKNRNR